MAFCVLSRNRKTFAVSSLVLNLFASQIGEFFLPHPVHTHTYIHTFIHKYIHKYIHTHTSGQLNWYSGQATRIIPRNHSSNPGKGKFILQERSYVTQESSMEGGGVSGSAHCRPVDIALKRIAAHLRALQQCTQSTGREKMPF